MSFDPYDLLPALTSLAMIALVVCLTLFLREIFLAVSYVGLKLRL